MIAHDLANDTGGVILFRLRDRLKRTGPMNVKRYN
jgi:hypothetical protein